MTITIHLEIYQGKLTYTQQDITMESLMLEYVFIYIHTLSKILPYEALHKFHSTGAQKKIHSWLFSLSLKPHFQAIYQFSVFKVDP